MGACALLNWQAGSQAPGCARPWSILKPPAHDGRDPLKCRAEGNGRGIRYDMRGAWIERPCRRNDAGCCRKIIKLARGGYRNPSVMPFAAIKEIQVRSG